MRNVMDTEKGLILIVRTTDEFLVKEEHIKKICFFHADCDNATGEK